MGSIVCCPEVGQLVVVRKRPFVVREIVPSAAEPALVGRVTSHILKLSSVEDDGLGEELDVVWELLCAIRTIVSTRMQVPVQFQH